MYRRDLTPELAQAFKEYPIVTLMGPRQSGKTTLIKSLFPDMPYYNLERPDIRQWVTDDPIAVLNKHPEGIIFDEVQRVPSLVSYLQVRVDEQKKKGMYILTGSHQPELHAAIAQSLAGRTAILHLLPLSLHEIITPVASYSTDDCLYRGFLPAIHYDDLNPTKYYRHYLETYIEKDVRQLIHIKDLLTFQRFIKLCAGRVGQMVNTNTLGNELGVSHNTIKQWLSVLQATFIITLLPPYFENFGKRVIKSPKLYFFDVGFVSFLLDIETPKQLERDPLRGFLFENMVVMEMFKARLHLGLSPNLYYYRDSMQHEVDVIYKTANEFIAFEIKASQTMDKRFAKNLDYFSHLVEGRCKDRYVVYSGQENFIGSKVSTIHFSQVYDVLLSYKEGS